jgi:hypothetical protein
MELSKVEVAIIEEKLNAVKEDQIRELNELQLAFVGGGIAELVGA